MERFARSIAVLVAGDGAPQAVSTKAMVPTEAMGDNFKACIVVPVFPLGASATEGMAGGGELPSPPPRPG